LGEAFVFIEMTDEVAKDDYVDEVDKKDKKEKKEKKEKKVRYLFLFLHVVFDKTEITSM
jgi:hypothetical protein